MSFTSLEFHRINTQLSCSDIMSELRSSNEVFSLKDTVKKIKTYLYYKTRFLNNMFKGTVLTTNAIFNQSKFQSYLIIQIPIRDVDIYVPRNFDSTYPKAIAQLKTIDVPDPLLVYDNLYNILVDVNKLSTDMVTDIKTYTTMINDKYGNFVDVEYLQRLERLSPEFNLYISTTYNKSQRFGYLPATSQFESKEDLRSTIDSLISLTDSFSPTVNKLSPLLHKTYSLLDNTISNFEKTGVVPQFVLEKLFELLSYVTTYTESYGAYIHEIQTLESSMTKVVQILLKS